MIIKKFLGKTEAEAIENAKKELGANVVVMNVRNAKRKGLFDFFKPQMVEVTVALEEETPAAEDTVSADVKAAVSAINEVVVSSINNAQTAQMESRQTGGLLNTGEEFSDKAFDKKENNAIEERLDSLQSLLEQQLQKPEEEKKEEVKGKCEVRECIKMLEVTNSVEEINEVIGFEAEKSEFSETYTWKLSSDNWITLKDRKSVV